MEVIVQLWYQCPDAWIDQIFQVTRRLFVIQIQPEFIQQLRKRISCSLLVSRSVFVLFSLFYLVRKQYLVYSRRASTKTDWRRHWRAWSEAFRDVLGGQRSTYLRRMMNAVKQCLKNSKKRFSSSISIISLETRIAWGNGFGSRPMMNPKSIWNNWPESRMSRLSRCRSPMPNKYVTTQ